LNHTQTRSTSILIYFFLFYTLVEQYILGVVLCMATMLVIACYWSWCYSVAKSWTVLL